MRNKRAESAAQDEVTRASAWEGHTHPWPESLVGFVTCPECGLTVDADMDLGG